jgi:phage-related protein
MPMSDDFIIEKNKQVNAPIWLYRVATDDDLTHDLFIAEWDADINFFKDTNTAQIYRSDIPITHEGIEENTEGKIGGMTIKVANASRELQAYLELHDGLRGRKVTIRQVFFATLDDSDAYIEDIYYIDTASVSDTVAEFKLTSKMDILQMTVPRRRFSRNYCPWDYKGAGCWLLQGDGSFVAPTPFSIDNTTIFLGTKEATGTTGILQPAIKIHPVDLFGLDMANDQVSLEMKITDHTRINIGAGGQFEITSAGTHDNEEIYYPNFGVLLSASWQAFTFNLADFVAAGATAFNCRAIDFLRAYLTITTGVAVTFSIRNIRIKRFAPYTFATASIPDSCNKTITDCKRHNNIARFGGFPNIPARSVFSVGR